jgi:2-iminobutanoate/2-iminopropanoate deaminase
VEKIVITSTKTPKAIGPYSVAIRIQPTEGKANGGLIFTSGQLGLDPASGNMVAGGIDAETRQALSNLKSVLEDADSGLEQVVKTTVFLKDMNDFPRMNAIYGEFFPENPPARSTLQVAALPKGGMVEIEAISLPYDR